jgi:NAD+ synthase (glutamine-hydrolysing)
MALSNKSGAMLLTTGNKSELAVGYCTLYGDMNGGLAVLSDVTKIEVYALSRWINANCAQAGFACPPIPESTITKPPSAELRANQFDQDSLPPYEQLDQIIERYVAMQEHPRRIVRETGLDPALVARIVRLIDVNEYKRKQMPIGLKVSAIAFGRGRRRPLAQGYRPDKELD